MSNKLVPAGFRVLVLPDQLEEMSKGGIILARLEERLHRQAQQTGVVVAIGPTAWKGFDEGEPWAKEGDRVVYSKFGGRTVVDPDEPETEYILLNDEDILATLEKVD